VGYRNIILSEADIENVTVAGQWLESPQINAAMMLIKMQFPYVGGLFDTTLGCWDLNFPASTYLKPEYKLSTMVKTIGLWRQNAKETTLSPFSIAWEIQRVTTSSDVYQRF
jgi:hypothetical protein